MTSMWGAPIHKRWRGSRLRDPRQAQFLTTASLKWVILTRVHTLVPGALLPAAEVQAGQPPRDHPRHGVSGQERRNPRHPGTGPIRDRWVHIGDKNTIRLTRFPAPGDKVVFGRDNVINCYIDIEFGDSANGGLVATSATSDHRMDSIELPIKRPGHRQKPGCDRPGHLDRDESDHPARDHHRPWLRARRARRREGRHPGLLDRGRLAGQGSRTESWRGRPPPPSVLNLPHTWPTSSARRPRGRARPAPQRRKQT